MTFNDTRAESNLALPNTFKKDIRKLKVKIKSLATEAQIIRSEEEKICKKQKALGDKKKPDLEKDRSSLHEHRIRVVRREQRAAMLAYAFLRGKPWAKCEVKFKAEPDWEAVRRIIKKFGGALSAFGYDALLQAFEVWKKRKPSSWETVPAKEIPGK